MKKNIFAIAALAFAVSACGPSGSQTSENSQAQGTCTGACTDSCPIKALFDQTLTLTQLNGSAIQSGCAEPAYIILAADRISAYVGCNRIFGTPTYSKGGKVAIEMGGATRMACPPECREDEFIEAFNKLAAIQVADSVVNFLNAEGNVLFSASK